MGANASPYHWRNIDEETINLKLSELKTKIDTVADLLSHMCTSNNYSGTEKPFAELCAQELGRGGFVQSFYYDNEEDMASCMKTELKPPFYIDLTYDEREQFEMVLKYRRDASWLIKPLTMMEQMMQQMPLLLPFQLIRLTITLDEECYDRSFYDSINKMVHDVANMLSLSAKGIQNGSSNHGAYFYPNEGRTTKADLDSDYIAKRIKDYKRKLQGYVASADSFSMSDNGVFSPSLNTVVAVTDLDNYMKKVAEAMKNSSEGSFPEHIKTCETLEAVLSARMGQCRIESFIAILGSLKTLKDAIQEFCGMFLNVYNSYKKRDEEAPYCFVIEPSEIKAAQKKDGFPIDWPDALTSGTKFMKLYNAASSALTRQCREYVEECDHIEFYR